MAATFDASVSGQRWHSTTENLRGSARRVVIMGPPGSGKSTLAASASQYAGDTLPLAKPVVCKDVVVFQGDTEGMAGAKACGLEIPNICDMTEASDFNLYMAILKPAVLDVQAMIKHDAVRYVIVDLNLPNTLLQAQIKPGNQKEWGEVKYQGMLLYKRFSSLRGTTIIACSQIKTSEAPGETEQAAAATAARSTGGERNLYTADLCKGVGSLWADNSSLTLSVDRRLVRDPVSKTRKPESMIYTQSNGKFEAKSRFGSILQPVEPGTRTLHSILRQVYGESL